MTSQTILDFRFTLELATFAQRLAEKERLLDYFAHNGQGMNLKILLIQNLKSKIPTQ